MVLIKRRPSECGERETGCHTDEARKRIDNHWFISDLHLGHKQVLQHDGRPFGNIETHDAILTANCAECGASNRTLWILGDVAWRRDGLIKFLDAVRPEWGRVNLIRGNHDDKVAWRHRDLFDEAHEAHYLRVDQATKVYLSHYAHRVWRNSHHGAYHLHGHSHGALPTWGRSMDVSANWINYCPIGLTRVIQQLQHALPINHHQSDVKS